MSPELKLLRTRRPSWATIRNTNGELEVVAEAIHPSGYKDAPVDLRIWSNRGRVIVSEKPPKQWPEGCPERHINRNGTFCLGVGNPLAPRNSADADDWWRWLHEFILSQRVAEETGIWPSTRALHHGDAYIFQKRMEQLALGTRFEREVEEALEANIGWLAGEIPRLSKDGSRLVNLRAPCPRGCKRRRRPILRRNCDEKALIFQLVKNERSRRDEEKAFWDENVGRVCCETMHQCPLR